MSHHVDQSSAELQATRRRLLKANLVIAALVLLANGSAMFLGLSGKAPEVIGSLPVIALILSVSAAVIATAIVALARPQFCQRALRFHSASLAAGATALALWGISLTTRIAEGAAPSALRVTWSVGWLTAFASYSAYLITQTYFADAREESIVLKFAYLWVGVLAFVVDIFVFSRLAASVVH